MCRYAIAVLCLVGLFASPVLGQKTGVEPIHATTGTVLTFLVQTRLHANNGNEADALAKGTVIYVKLLDSIDSSVDRDGAEFHGVVVSPILSATPSSFTPNRKLKACRVSSSPPSCNYGATWTLIATFCPLSSR
jgi:hypothetical protein